MLNPLVSLCVYIYYSIESSFNKVMRRTNFKAPLWKPPKERRKTLRIYDERITSAIRKHKNGTFTLKQYWAEIVQLKADYGFQQFK